MRPLVVDLDGTLIRSDMLYESAAALLRQKPWLAFAIPAWLAKGRANLKHQIATRVTLDPALLPYNEEFLQWITEEHTRGREVVLATASDLLLANPIAARAAIFDQVIGSDSTINQKGATKLATLAAKYGTDFAYAGNSSADLAIWRGCAEAIVVNSNRGTLQAARSLGKVTQEFPALPLTYSMFRQTLRIPWCQIVLTASLVPMLLLHNPLWAVAALVICCLLSGVFLARDLLNLQRDRAIPSLASRPVTSGAFPIAIAVFLAPLLVTVGIGGMVYIAARSAG